MRKILSLFICLILVLEGFSQHTEIDKKQAFALVKNTANDLNFSPEDIENVKVAQSYGDLQLGITYIYLQQTFKDIPVHNRIIILAYKNGKLISRSGSLFANAKGYSNDASPTPSVTPQVAIQTAAAGVKAKIPSSFSAPQEKNGKLDFGLLDIAYENVTTQLLWMPVEKAGSKTSLQLVWQVLIAPVNTDDMWYVRVDAKNNTIINKDNLTVFEEFKSHDKNSNSAEITTNNKTTENINSPVLVGTANYLVIPYPVESPLYGSAAVATNPWTMAGSVNANATSLKWHNDGVTDYTITRGNNVWATEDRVAANQNTGLPATSTTVPDPLNFNFPPDYTAAPTTPAFQQFAITNLFYWNNVIHDMAYNYGFDEVSGNFQASNQGRGGAGNDHVMALAQSGAGTNNANFSTPADGGRGRMRMYLFTAPNPDRDGDLDASIMCHEYMHGISNRFTGGIAGAGGCLSNAEEGGEGWGDYFGLMMTTNWSTALITDGFNKKRPIGNYALGQAATGNGIRSKPYSTNFAVNNLTYAYVAASGGEVHDIGEVWCATLWDMTWDIIQMDGINPNLFNNTGVGGNSIALKLVTEGMRLQPCSPGFLDARDGILKADQLLYGGRYHCAILGAFARRGMGTDARQGSSSATNDQVVGFSTVETALTLTQSVTQQQEGLNVTYTNKVTAGPCAALTNFLLTDTLPANVTYVSGGAYNSTTRVVSFPVNLAAGTSQAYSFTVQINAGSYFPTVTLFEDHVTAATIPAATWSTSSTTAVNWVVSNARSNTAPSSYYSSNNAVITDKRLFFTNPVALGPTPPNLSFWHWYNTEGTYDGGILEISTDGGTSYNYVPAANILKGGYSAIMDASTVLSGKRAWSGNSNGFIKTVVDLTPYANQSVKLRFRSTTDNGTSLEGWYVDDIAIQRAATADIQSNLFNAGGTLMQVADTFTVILPLTTCTSVSVTTPPSSTAVCAGSNATFTVTAAGLSPAYQWQVSTNGGTTFTDIPGATGATLTLTGVTLAMNNNQYHVIVSNGCPSSATSADVTLTVNAATSITTQPGSVTTCSGSTANFCVTAAGANLTYQWQVSAAGCGGPFANIAGATSSCLSLPGITPAQNGFTYKVVVTGICAPVSVTSNCVTLTVNSAAVITTQPVDQTKCSGASVTFTTAATGSGIVYQWQISTDGGTTYTNITGETNPALTINSITVGMNNNKYRALISGSCAANTPTNAATLTVQSAPAITVQPMDITSCTTTAVFTVTATGSAITYQWQVSTDGGVTYINITGATTNVLTLNGLTAAMTNHKYRVVISTVSCGTVTSNAVTAKVGLPPVVILTASPTTVYNPSLAGGLFTTVSPAGNYTYQWKRDNILLPTSNSFIIASNGLLYDFGTYQVTVTDAISGCSGLSNIVTITDDLNNRNHLFISPNPTKGIVRVSYYSNTTATQDRMINIYDERGAAILTKNFTVSGRYGYADFDLSGFVAGTYVIVLRNASGKQIASGRVIKY